MEHLTRFPRWRLLARVVVETEEELGSLPMVLVTPVVAAVVGAAVAFVYTPAEHVRKGLVDTPSLWTSLGLAAVGAVVGILLVLAVLGLWFWLSYRVRPERTWSLAWADGDNGRAFTLVSHTIPASDPVELANLEIWMARAQGEFEVVGGDAKLYPGGGMAWRFGPGEVSAERRAARVYSHQPGKHPFEVLRTRIGPIAKD